jgi:hypothetical protein
MAGKPTQEAEVLRQVAQGNSMLVSIRSVETIAKVVFIWLYTGK